MWRGIPFYWVGFIMGSISGRRRCEDEYYYRKHQPPQSPSDSTMKVDIKHKE